MLFRSCMLFFRLKPIFSLDSLHWLSCLVLQELSLQNQHIIKFLPISSACGEIKWDLMYTALSGGYHRENMCVGGNSPSHIHRFAIPWTVSLSGSSVHRIFSARILEWVVISSSKRSSQPRDQTQVSCITGKFFTMWDTKEAQGSGVGSLSLFQEIFPTQESNWGRLHCRQSLHQLSYQGSP